MSHNFNKEQSFGVRHFDLINYVLEYLRQITIWIQRMTKKYFVYIYHEDTRSHYIPSLGGSMLTGYFMKRVAPSPKGQVATPISP